MRTDLDHLPEAKQRELAHVVEVIREGFAEAISRRTMGRFRNGKILKIILFGSYARATGSKIRSGATSPTSTCWSSSATKISPTSPITGI